MADKDKDKAEKKHITIGDMMHIFTAGFDIFFKDYLDSNGSMVPTHERMTECIAWYNSNIEFILLNVQCPVERVQEINMRNYMWAFACCWTASENIKLILNPKKP